MNASNKGQIELEAIVAAMFALGVLLLVLIYTSAQKDEINSIERLDMEKNQCSQISSIISLMQANKTNDSIDIETANATTATSHTISIGNYYCYFTGNVLDASLSRGKIRIHEKNGAVLLENT